MIVLASMFRNSAGYVGRYLGQVNALRGEGIDVRLVIAEGDSTDDTYALLKSHKDANDTLLKVDHGGRHYGSIDHPQRWANIATVLCSIVRHTPLDEADSFIWVESDLVWTPPAMLTLLQDLDSVSAVAPMVFAGNSTRFYDIWGFRKDGQPFTGAPPHHPSIHGIIPIDSCGSCFVLSPAAYPSLRDWDGIWPFTAGGHLHLDPSAVIWHP